MTGLKYQKNFKAAIHDAGMNQRQFAELVGVDESFVSRVVTGRWVLEPLKAAVWAAHLGKQREEIFRDN